MKPYYQDDYATIYHGDCREILPRLEPVDLVLTDPPYGTENLGGGYGRRQLHTVDGRKGRTIANDCNLGCLMSAAPMLEEKLTAGGWLATYAAARRMFEVHHIFLLAGLDYIGHVVWDKGAPGLGYTIRYSHEDVLVFRKGTGDAPVDAVISVTRAGVGTGRTNEHPHEKPAAVWLRLCQLSMGSILDPFMGSGTVLRAAKDLQRKAVGIEIEEKYCEIAAKRLRQEVLPLVG